MTETLRVLLVEDSETDAKLILRELRRGSQAIATERVEDGASMRRALETAQWHVILADWSLPKFSALDALQLVHEMNVDLPFIIVSGTVGDEMAVSAMRAGANDYILKDKLARLRPAIEREVRDARERAAKRAAEGALRLHEARFRALVEQSSEGISVTTDGLRGATYLSPGGKRILGLREGDPSGPALRDIVHPDDRDIVTDLHNRVARVGAETVFGEFRIVRPDGTVRWIETRSVNLLGDPAVAGIVTNFGDVTERHEAIEAVRTSEARYRKIIETTSEGVWMLDAEQKTTFVNGRLAEMFGYEVREMIGRTVFDFVRPEDLAKTKASLARRARGIDEQLEHRYQRKDGSELWALLAATAVLDEDGRYAGALAMVRDVTEARAAQAALRSSEARFRRLWDSGIILIMVADVEGRIREINPAGLQMLGYSAEEFATGNLGLDSMTPPEFAERDAQARAELATLGMARPYEKELIRKDGTRVPVLGAAAVLDGSEGIAIAIDLSDRKHAELALQRSEALLRQAQKMEAIGRLAGGVAHDFNNILSVILSYSEMLLEELKAGDPMRESIDAIRGAGVRAAALTRQLLMFSRQNIVEPKLIHLNEILAGMETMLRRILGEDVEMTTQVGPSIGFVLADPSNIEQVIMNLVVNARDAMPTGGKLTIETSEITVDDPADAPAGLEAGRYVLLAVSDSGIGMDAATRARIFEPFFTTKEKGKGTGLGLSMVFGTVQQAGGSIWVYSEPGAGSVFKVYLPLAEGAPAPGKVPLTFGEVRGNETILLVEDEIEVRLVALGILRRLGYQVLEAANGGEALLLCESHPAPIHLLLSDVVMPRMSGPELGKRLLRLRPTMKVLHMSGYTDDSVVRHGILTAEVQYLQKPFTPMALGRKVRDVLDAAPAKSIDDAAFFAKTDVAPPT